MIMIMNIIINRQSSNIITIIIIINHQSSDINHHHHYPQTSVVTATINIYLLEAHDWFLKMGFHMEWRCFSFMSIFTKHLECDYSVMCDWKPLLLLFCPSSSLPLLLLWLSPEQKNCMSHINCARKKARVNNPCHISTRIWVTWCYLKRGVYIPPIFVCWF